MFYDHLEELFAGEGEILSIKV